MFNAKTNYRVSRAVKLSHVEFRKTDKGTERVRVDDCRYLCDPEDFDLEVQMRSGENLKAVPTALYRGDVNIIDKRELTNKEIENG